MDGLRFPLGQFVAIVQPSPEQRDNWIHDIAEFPRDLRLTVQNLTLAQLHTEYRPGGWTVQQVVHHLADNDMNAFIRFKRALTEDDLIASSYREDLWAELSDYHQTPIEASLVLLEALHNRFVDLLQSLSEADFQRTFTTMLLGEITLHVAAQRYAWHGRHHLAQITALINRSFRKD